MNQGFFGFPNILDPNLIDIKEFDVSGSYSIPVGTKMIQIIAIGAGGGGGSGRRRAAATAQNGFGGGGGGGGSFINHTFLREQIDGQVLNIVIGAGGAGGAARTTDNTSGANGLAGGTTTIASQGKSGFLLFAPGGAQGSGGTTTNATAGAGRAPLFNGTVSNTQPNGAAGTATATPGSITLSFYWTKGGAAGGGHNNVLTPTIVSNGGSIFMPSANSLFVLNPQYAVGSTILSGNRSNDVQSAELNGVGFFPLGKYSGGIGGAGGGAGTTVAATNGGNGWRGGGGAGGGASLSGLNSGAGGRGGNGYVAIFSYK
jgi:hypothetical protein